MPNESLKRTPRFESDDDGTDVYFSAKLVYYVCVCSFNRDFEVGGRTMGFSSVNARSGAIETCFFNGCCRKHECKV